MQVKPEKKVAKTPAAAKALSAKKKTVKGMEWKEEEDEQWPNLSVNTLID